MPASEFWTDSQRNAWEYVQSGINRGLGQVAALTEYRSGGGAIRTTLWGELWHRYSESKDTWGNMFTLKPTDTVPESFYTETGIDYKNKYVLNFSVDIRLEGGQILNNVFRTISSNEKLTVAEWQAAIDESMQEDTSYFTEETLQVRSMEFYKKA